MRFVTATICGCLFVACQGNTMTPGTVGRADLVPYSENINRPTEVTQPGPKSKPREPIDMTTILIPDQATTPVPVAGAHFVCIEGKSVSCAATDSEGQPLNFEPSTAYYSVVNEKTVWLQTTFTQNTAGAWTIVIPETMYNQALNMLLIDETGHYVSGLTVNPEDPDSNRVPDGSFENQTISPLAIDLTRTLIPPTQLTWKALVPIDLVLCHPVLELSSLLTDSTGNAEHGNQWVELTAPCILGRDERNTIGITQVLNLIPGRQYLLSFAYKSPLGLESQTVLRLAMGETVLFEQTIATSAWKTFQTLYTANSTETRITFTEHGPAAHRGTALDAISVIDMDLAGSQPLSEGSNLPTVIPR